MEENGDLKTHISVIIPAHNEEKYIKRCLDSIKAADQRFPGNTVAGEENSGVHGIIIGKRGYK